MQIINAEQTAKSLDWHSLINALRAMFIKGCNMPIRHHHNMSVVDGYDATMLIMPAWLDGQYIGVKLVNIFPNNSKYNMTSIHGNYMLSNGKTGEMLAIIDGGELTARRTAAASALASCYLSRKDSKKLLIVGTGRLSINLAMAHSNIRPIDEIKIWGRDFNKAQNIATKLSSLGYNAAPCADLEKAVNKADIISCATLAEKPLINGKWLKYGTHLDLVGGFRASMREADDNAIIRASVFVDTFDGCLNAGEFCPGDIKSPIENGILNADDLVDLFQLTKGQHKGRNHDKEITIFKSVGSALEDLAGAIIAYEKINNIA